MKRRIFIPAVANRTSAAGFTLVELMVALTGGLFVSLAVFALARDSGRFYQRESRVANATVSALMGFERLRGDLARAGFMASPNVARDIAVCAKPNGGSTWPAALANLASVQIQQPAATGVLAANGRSPQGLTLAGSYTSSDQYPARVVNNGATVSFFLVPGTTALTRLGNGANPTNQAVQAVFDVGRGLRFVQYGQQYYGQIIGSNGGAAPQVTVNNAPQIQFRSGALGGCGANIIGSGAGEGTINVVNFIHYDLRNLSTSAQTPRGATDYASLYAESAAGPGEAQRTELVRVEQDVTGAAIDTTEEVVAEYAVDLAFQITAVTAIANCCDPTVLPVAPGSANFSRFTGPVSVANTQPELIRTVRVRLGMRSRESDRAGGIAADATAPATQGLFRFDLGPTAAPDRFARIRTFQADVVLNNQVDVLW